MPVRLVRLKRCFLLIIITAYLISYTQVFVSCVVQLQNYRRILITHPMTLPTFLQMFGLRVDRLER